MTGKDVFLLQQTVDDTHVADLLGFRWIDMDDFTSAALVTLLVNERSQLGCVMHLTVVFIQAVSASELLLTEATTKVRGSLGSFRFLCFVKLTRR